MISSTFVRKRYRNGAIDRNVVLAIAGKVAENTTPKPEIVQ
jgi:hypothetical protein